MSDFDPAMALLMALHRGQAPQDQQGGDAMTGIGFGGLGFPLSPNAPGFDLATKKKGDEWMGGFLRGGNRDNSLFDRFRRGTPAERGLSEAQQKSLKDAEAAQAQRETQKLEIEKMMAELRSAKNPNAIPNASDPSGWSVRDPVTKRFMNEEQIREAAQNAISQRANERLASALRGETSDAVDLLRQGRDIVNNKTDLMRQSWQAPPPGPIPPQSPYAGSYRDQAWQLTAPERSSLYSPMTAATREAQQAPLSMAPPPLSMPAAIGAALNKTPIPHIAGITALAYLAHRLANKPDHAPDAFSGLLPVAGGK